MSNILDDINRRDGTTVPPDYFARFAERMEQQLPKAEWEETSTRVMPRSFWQRVRPYLYMAAMFMGVWCMMKMVDLMRSDSPLSIDGNPVLTAALNNDHFINEYFINEGDISDNQLIDDLFEIGADIPDDIALEADSAAPADFDESTEPTFPLSE